ncbi:hypothetical protein TanjilG_23388 [Lupinus angustifolius]|uniref:Zinc-finger domain-containing protein n=1 Tax=Lupinus angustifolius TaxID=3871 RepID=A0A4P1R925_LUPAN|nr:hypothetical protein TanjilG_23388 [Lupinus angustifolius]
MPGDLVVQGLLDSLTHVTDAKMGLNLKGNKKTLSKVRQVRSQTNKKIPPSLPLRRSARNVKSLYLQHQMNGGNKKGIHGKKNVGRKKRKQSKSKKLTSQKSEATTVQLKNLAVTTERKKRTNICTSYWLNGLWLSRKPNDERVMLFREKKHVVFSEDFPGTLDHYKCRLCCQDGCTSNYIACGTCGDWYHGDAFGLTLDNARQLIGFRCHVCRDRAAPVCPHIINALPHTESNAATECAEESSKPISLLPLSENDRDRPFTRVYTRRSKHGIRRDGRREEGGGGNSKSGYFGLQQVVLNTESKNEGEQEDGIHNKLSTRLASIGGEEDLGITP